MMTMIRVNMITTVVMMMMKMTITMMIVMEMQGNAIAPAIPRSQCSLLRGVMLF